MGKESEENFIVINGKKTTIKRNSSGNKVAEAKAELEKLEEAIINKHKGYRRIKTYRKQIKALIEELPQKPEKLVEAEALICIAQLKQSQPSYKDLLVGILKADTLYNRAKKKAFRQYEKHGWFRRAFITPITEVIFDSVYKREQQKRENRWALEQKEIQPHIGECDTKIKEHKEALQRIKTQKAALNTLESEIVQKQRGLPVPSLFKRLIFSTERNMYKRIQAHNKRLKQVRKNLKQLTALEKRLRNNLTYQTELKNELTTINNLLQKRLTPKGTLGTQTTVSQSNTTVSSNTTTAPIMSALAKAINRVNTNDSSGGIISEPVLQQNPPTPKAPPGLKKPART